MIILRFCCDSTDCNDEQSYTLKSLWGDEPEACWKAVMDLLEWETRYDEFGNELHYCRKHAPPLPPFDWDNPPRA